MRSVFARAGFVGVAVGLCAGCSPRTITHKPAIAPVVTVSPTTGMPGILLFGETEGEARQRFRELLYVDEGDGSQAYDGAYALVYYSDKYRQVERLIFDFDQLQEHGVKLTVQIAYRNRQITVRRETPPAQFLQSVGCRDRLVRGGRTRPDKHILVPLQQDKPCLVTGNISNDSYRSDYTFNDTYTVASFTKGHLERLFVIESSLHPGNGR